MKKDIIPLYNADAVKQAVKNLVLTNHGEKLFRPKVGGNVAAQLFENVGRFTAVTIQNDISEMLKKYEKRVTNVSVTVDDNADRNEYNVSIEFSIVGSNIQTETSFALTRIK